MSEQLEQMITNCQLVLLDLLETISEWKKKIKGLSFGQRLKRFEAKRSPIKLIRGGPL